MWKIIIIMFHHYLECRSCWGGTGRPCTRTGGWRTAPSPWCRAPSPPGDCPEPEQQSCHNVIISVLFSSILAWPASYLLILWRHINGSHRLQNSVGKSAFTMVNVCYYWKISDFLRREVFQVHISYCLCLFWFITKCPSGKSHICNPHWNSQRRYQAFKNHSFSNFSFSALPHKV